MDYGAQVMPCLIAWPHIHPGIIPRSIKHVSTWSRDQSFHSVSKACNGYTGSQQARSPVGETMMEEQKELSDA